MTAPTREIIVSDFDFATEVVQLGHHNKSISTFIDNTSESPRAFWFGVRSNASQPTVFQTGPSATLLSDVNITTGYSVSLQPDNPIQDYVAEEYTLYGITLQSGKHIREDCIMSNYDGLTRKHMDGYLVS